MAGRSYSKVMLIGNCSRDPEVRQQQQYKVVSISLATNEWKPDGNGGFNQTTEWHRIKFWNYNADKALNQIRKGMRLFIEGRLTINSYPDKNHPEIIQRNYEITADNFIILDRRNEGDYAQGNGQYNDYGNNNNSGYQSYGGGSNNYNGFAPAPSNFNSFGAQGGQQSQGYGSYGGNNFGGNNSFSSQGGFNNLNNRNSNGMGGAGNGGEDVPF